MKAVREVLTWALWIGALGVGLSIGMRATEMVRGWATRMERRIVDLEARSASAPPLVSVERKRGRR